MGEYAHDAMRQEIKQRHGLDIGEYEDEPKRSHAKPVYKRVKCPHCDARPKEAGLKDHIKAKHTAQPAKNARSEYTGSYAGFAQQISPPDQLDIMSTLRPEQDVEAQVQHCMHLVLLYGYQCHEQASGRVNTYERIESALREALRAKT